MSVHGYYQGSTLSGSDLPGLGRQGLPNNQEHLRNERRPKEKEELKNSSFVASGEQYDQFATSKSYRTYTCNGCR